MYSTAHTDAEADVVGEGNGPEATGAVKAVRTAPNLIRTTPDGLAWRDNGRSRGQGRYKYWYSPYSKSGKSDEGS